MKARWWWVAGLGIASLVLLGWLGPDFSSRHLTPSAGSGARGATATSGRDQPEATDADVSPATIHEIETITGAVDGHELIGRRVDLHLKAVGVTNEGAFWVGPHDNPVLVAPARDRRTTRRPVREGEAVTIRGMIQEMPNAKERLSWGLAAPELLRLTDQKIYIRADRVIP